MKDVCIRELAAWGFDRYRYRPTVDRTKVNAAKKTVRERLVYRTASPLCEELTAQHGATLASYALRSDLLAEMDGLKWSLAIVDLRKLLAFQRRLSFDPGLKSPIIPTSDDWPALFELAFAPPKTVRYSLQQQDNVYVIRSTDPNLHVRCSSDNDLPFVMHGGSPFFEVARYRNRWFLRDGYHRAYALMRDHVFAVPAVIVEARTLHDLGADQPQFFPEATLLSGAPPHVPDFLDDSLIIAYERPEMTRTIRIKITESFAASADEVLR